MLSLRPQHGHQSPWLKKDIETLEKVQKKAVGMVSELTGRSYEEKCKELGIETLEARREKQDLFEALNIFKEPGPNNAERLQKQQTRNGAVTRNSAEPWNAATIQRSIQKCSFTGLTADAWNKLPAELKASQTLTKFKNVHNPRSDRRPTGSELIETNNCERSTTSRHRRLEQSCQRQRWSHLPK